MNMILCGRVEKTCAHTVESYFEYEASAAFTNEVSVLVKTNNKEKDVRQNMVVTQRQGSVPFLAPCAFFFGYFAVLRLLVSSNYSSIMM
ncbi:unnamed protein product [Amoebophrya sp. A120]|nr:unnamed protein product [Amoebophrya sp. A120]|eukprot:GSA120T00020861001.1